MKTARLLTFAALAAMSVSCAKELNNTVKGEQQISRITASFVEEDAKTVLADNGTSVLWSPNDEINIFYNTIGVKFTSLNTTPLEKTIFASSQALFYNSTESGVDTEEPYFWGVYPYNAGNTSDGESVTVSIPCEQIAVCNSFGRNSFAAIGRSRDTKMAFYNVCGGIRFTLVNTGIKSITISGNNNEVLAGKVKVVFDENGKPKVSQIADGQKTITLIAPDNGEFEVGKWYYISILPVEFSSGFSFEFLKKENYYGVKTIVSSKTIKRSIFGEIGEMDKSVEFLPFVKDLSAFGTANCYVVPAAGDYKFKATVKGGSTESVGTPASAEVIWESFGTDVTPSKGDIVKSVSLESGYVVFSTPSALANGNAVIAVKDASGNILWSWHIWVCKDFDPAKTAQVYNNSAGTMMDRNLGATSATPGDVHALGLLYQWGRKDPFLSGDKIYDSSYPASTAASTLSWPSPVESNSSNGTIAYAVAHPTTFITYNSSNYDWYYTGSSSTDNTRWQTSDKTKGMYDPCPAGWRVPDGGGSGVWSKAFGSRSYYMSGPWDDTNRGMNFGSGNGQSSTHQLGSPTTIWYPAAGYRSSDDGSLYNVGSLGYYWSCSSFDTSAYNLLISYTGAVEPSSLTSRAYGQVVRCLSESK